MSCTFDQELIALYAGGDLTADEREGVEAHLLGCSECRRLDGLLRQNAVSLAGMGAATAAVPGPRKRSLASRRWLTAAAAFLLMLVFAPQVRAVGARLIELFPFLHVREMSQQELDEINNRPSTGEVHYPVSYASVEEAEKVLKYKIGRIHEIPEGFKLVTVSVSFPHQPINSTVNQVFAKGEGFLVLDQTRSGQITAMALEGSTREVRVKGKRAALVTRERSRSLFFPWEGQPMSLTASGIGPDQLSDEELIKIAESVR